jgi:hypothetical protein
MRPERFFRFLFFVARYAILKNNTCNARPPGYPSEPYIINPDRLTRRYNYQFLPYYYSFVLITSSSLQTLLVQPRNIIISDAYVLPQPRINGVTLENGIRFHQVPYHYGRSKHCPGSFVQDWFYKKRKAIGFLNIYFFFSAAPNKGRSYKNKKKPHIIIFFCFHFFLFN